ncbi:hypothetical protein [Streptomyces lycii]|uniref:Cellulose synthase n=1 Tax=Streptomyces lycii TaxID=2654337 RepID=A0ABQ7FGI2_9ACTN|nr:hypothetical protein [Streptomyces lycii]KAF4407940.1 hypothetical protein GCU69_16965 [Streptomyces lycii]
MLTTTICVALSAAGLAIALLTAYRRRFAAATRIAAFALLPVGLAMAGLVDLGADVVAAAADWGTDLVLKPAVWGGFGVLAVSAVLFVTARVAGRRGGSRKERKAAGAARRDAVAPGASAPALGSGDRAAGPRAAPKQKSGATDTAGLDGLEDIEAILRKHGI